MKTRIPKALQVFAWNLSLETPFGRKSLALNVIERGRAWHWRQIPKGWLDVAFIMRHGQPKTKRAFAEFIRRARAKGLS